jgi:hypothetical protein
MPQACYFQGGASGCSQRLAPEGEYLLRVEAQRAAPTCGAACECAEPLAEGACRVRAEGIGLVGEVAVTKPLAMPGTTAVSLAFE